VVSENGHDVDYRGVVLFKEKSSKKKVVFSTTESDSEDEKDDNQEDNQEDNDPDKGKGIGSVKLSSSLAAAVTVSSQLSDNITFSNLIIKRNFNSAKVLKAEHDLACASSISFDVMNEILKFLEDYYKGHSTNNTGNERENHNLWKEICDIFTLNILQDGYLGNYAFLFYKF
jgi:hypothetical protein